MVNNSPLIPMTVFPRVARSPIPLTPFHLPLASRRLFLLVLVPRRASDFKPSRERERGGTQNLLVCRSFSRILVVLY